MKKNVIILGTILVSTLSFGQIGINTATPNRDAALDVVSTNKGILNTRIALSSTSSPSPLSAHVAGMMVYNTATVNDVVPALYYNDGTKWVLTKNTGAGTTTNVLSSTGNILTSTVNGIASNTNAVNTVGNTSSGNTLSTTVNGVVGTAVPIINSNALSLSGTNLTSNINGISSTAVNLAPAITAATTNALSSSGNIMTSTVNGIARNAPVINSISNTISGNTLTTTVNGISSSSVTLPQSVNIYNSDGTLTDHRTVSMNKKELFFTQDTNNQILFDIGSTITGSTRIYSMGSSGSIIRTGVGSRTLDMELLSNGTSRLLSTGTSELFVGTNTSSGPLTLGVGTNRAVLATNGNFGIGTITPSQKLDVVGNIKASGSLMSGTATYPDYVFENYYKGTSEINSNYQFKKLEEVEEFIKKEGHLPGYKSLEEVKQTNMTVDVTQNSITNMEKIEELYLYVFELKKEIKALREKSAELKKLINKN